MRVILLYGCPHALFSSLVAVSWSCLALGKYAETVEIVPVTTSQRSTIAHLVDVVWPVCVEAGHVPTKFFSSWKYTSRGVPRLRFPSGGVQSRCRFYSVYVCAR